MKELQAALKGFTQKNETLKLETKVRLHEILVTFTFMLHVAGFSIEGGTRRLIAAYFGIYSRLLCV